jgi:hypothetical protein
MEVHQHTHTARKKWTHYFWEFLMLFLAVFCGFLAEYQLEHKIEHDRERQFIRSLVEDLSEDTVTLAGLVTDLRENVARMDTFKFLLAADDVRNHGADLYYLGRRASRGAFLALHDRTIQQMKNSGAFRLIRNEKVSKAILEYYNRLNFIETLQQIDLSESEEYRKMAVGVFDPIIFDGLIPQNNVILRPTGNPPLLTYDKAILLRMAGMVSYSKNSRLALANAEEEMKTAAINLIGLLKKEYHLK